MRMLIADDDDFSRMMLQKVLERHGHEVTVCRNGEQAWEALQSPGAPNLVILDWEMPGLTGPEVCRRARELRRERPFYFLLLTSRSGSNDVIEGLRSGANDYLTKPASKSEVIARVHVALRMIELEEQLIAERARIAASARLASLGQLAAGIAHEINNPLAIVLSHAEHLRNLARVARNDEPLREPVSDGAEAICSTVDRMARIIRSLHALAGNASHEPCQETTAEAVIRDAALLCEGRFRKSGIRLEIPSPPDLRLECRPIQISQILINLLCNALHAAAPTSGRWVRLEAEDRGDGAAFVVTDSGAGIPQGIRERIMDPFFTTRDIGQGLGLGLSIARGLVEAHGGTLSLDSRSPHTRFVVLLPKRQQPAGEESLRTVAGARRLG